MRTRRALWVPLAVLVAVALAVPQARRVLQGSEGGADERRHGAVRLAVTAVGSLDPARARSVDQVLVVDQLFDSLTAVDATTGRVVPSLASRWEASADLREWTFHLRPGAVFSDGRPLRAADVKYSLERIARPGSGSLGADLLAPVSGYAAFRAGAAELSGVQVLAPGAVRVTLDAAWAVLPEVLAAPVFGVVPRAAVEAAPPAPAFAERPVGSGPFRLAARRGPTLVLVATPGSPARVARLEITRFSDQRSAYRAFAAGRADWARVPPDEVEEAARRFGSGAFRPYAGALYYGFNLRSPTFADVRFRQAVMRAVDRRAIADAVYHGTVRPLESVAGVGGSGAGERRPACAGCRYDPGAARALLRQAFPTGAVPPVTIDYDDDPSQAAVARAVEANLRAVGIPVVRQAHDAGAYDDFLLSGRQQLFRLAWIAPYISPDAFVAPLFTTGSPNNLTEFASPAVDELVTRARSEPDAQRRHALYEAAERAVLEQAVVVPLVQFELHTVVAERVRGLAMDGLGSFDAARVTLGAGG